MKEVVVESQDREYLGYNLFYQIDNKRIQAWNRLMVFLNILGHKGSKIASEYLKQVDAEGVAALKSISAEMTEKGYTVLHKEVWNSNVQA
jgi:hypothetical protein